jgi:hypothetical protein
MNLADLLRELPPAGLEGLAFPRNLLGAFRRKSITFCTGVTDETTIVYWFQSGGFTIDLRLTEGAATPIVDRQGWVGDTLWDRGREELSWSITRSYQPRDQWPEPARFRLTGNCVLEFAPSGAYFEDWRQQSAHGPLLGLRLMGMIDDDSGHELEMDGGLILAGRYMAYAQSRLPHVDAALRTAASLDRALAEGIVTESEIESYEVSVAPDGQTIAHSTRPDLLGEAIALGDFELQPDGSVVWSRTVQGATSRLRFAQDLYVPDFVFDRQTASTREARQWIEREKGHLFRNAAVVL